MRLARTRPRLPRPLAIRVLGSVVLAAALSGCGAAASPSTPASQAASATPASSVTSAPITPAPVATIPAGWKVTDVTADGYSIATPKGWTSVTLAGSDLDSLIAQFKTANPELAAILQNARDAGQSFSFMALDTDPAIIGDTGFAPNVNVVVSDSQGYSDDIIATATIVQLRQLSSVQGDVEDEKIALPADVGAHRLRYHLKATATLSTVATLYILTKGTKTYAVTMSAVESQVTGLEDTFASIATSLVFAP